MHLLIALLLAGAAPPDPGLFDAATGYRIDRYRAPVPEAPAGVRRIEVAEVRALLAKGVAVLDVTPVRARGWDPATGRWLPSEAHEHVPGTRWYPETGRGTLDPDIEAWFRKVAERESRGDRNATLVTYCLADCWMSWNAARRLREWGYVNVLWFATGADGWREAGLPLVPATPEPMR